MPKGRGRRDSESDIGTEEQGTVGTFETLRDEGEHFVHVKQYERAIESFTKALEMKPGDKTCLVTRSKCYLMLGNSEAALTDSEAALENEEEGKGKDIRALCMKAEALYQKGDFETALVYYHRGHKLRPELQEFRLGIQKSQEAINNSIGTPDSVKLEASGDLTFFYKQDEKQKQQQKGTYSKPSQIHRREEKKERTKPQDGGSTKTTKQLLGELYNDRAFLEKLYDGLTASTEPGDTDRYVKDRAVDGLEYLTMRADFWRQQKPMYARERDRRRQQQQQSARSRGGDQDPMQYILQRLEEIDEAQANGKYEQSLKKSRKTLDKVEASGDDRIKNRPALVANLYSCMGNAYLEMNKYKEALEYHSKDLSIGEKQGIEEAESRALDNLGRTKARMGKYQDAIELWEKKLPKSKSPLESTWLYHEIGRCHLELGQFAAAKDYGEKSLAAAQEADDGGWQLHATVLIAQAEVKCSELQAAADSFERAQEFAVKLNDSSAQAAIKKALEEVNNRIVQGVQDDDKDRPEGDDDDDGRRSVSSDKAIKDKDDKDAKDKANKDKKEQEKEEAASSKQEESAKKSEDDGPEPAAADSSDKERNRRIVRWMADQTTQLGLCQPAICKKTKKTDMKVNDAIRPKRDTTKRARPQSAKQLKLQPGLRPEIKTAEEGEEYQGGTDSGPVKLTPQTLANDARPLQTAVTFVPQNPKDFKFETTNSSNTMTVKDSSLSTEKSQKSSYFTKQLKPKSAKMRTRPQAADGLRPKTAVVSREHLEKSTELRGAGGRRLKSARPPATADNVKPVLTESHRARFPRSTDAKVSKAESSSQRGAFPKGFLSDSSDGDSHCSVFQLTDDSDDHDLNRFLGLSTSSSVRSGYSLPKFSGNKGSDTQLWLQLRSLLKSSTEAFHSDSQLKHSPYTARYSPSPSSTNSDMWFDDTVCDTAPPVRLLSPDYSDSNGNHASNNCSRRPQHSASIPNLALANTNCSNNWCGEASVSEKGSQYTANLDINKVYSLQNCADRIGSMIVADFSEAVAVKTTTHNMPNVSKGQKCVHCRSSAGQNKRMSCKGISDVSSQRLGHIARVKLIQRAYCPNGLSCPPRRKRGACKKYKTMTTQRASTDSKGRQTDPISSMTSLDITSLSTRLQTNLNGTAECSACGGPPALGSHSHEPLPSSNAFVTNLDCLHQGRPSFSSSVLKTRDKSSRTWWSPVQAGCATNGSHEQRNSGNSPGARPVSAAAAECFV